MAARILPGMVKDGRVSMQALMAFDMFDLSRRFNWTPKQIREMSFMDKMMYKAIIGGLESVPNG